MTEPASDVLGRIRAGAPLEHIPVIDFHTHVNASSDYYYIPFHEDAQILACMDRYGIDHIVAFGLNEIGRAHV